MEAAQLVAGLCARFVESGEPVPALQVGTVGFVPQVHVCWIAHLPTNESAAAGDWTQEAGCQGRRGAGAESRRVVGVETTSRAEELGQEEEKESENRGWGGAGDSLGGWVRNGGREVWIVEGGTSYLGWVLDALQYSQRVGWPGRCVELLAGP